MKHLAWMMTIDTTLEFFKRCQERNANTEEERVKILAELAQEGSMLSVTATDKSKEDYIADKAKHFKILRIDKTEKE